MSTQSWEISWLGNTRASELGAARRGTGKRTPDDGDQEVFHAELSGFEEVPAILTPASGRFTARVSDDETEIEFELTYSDLSTPSTEAHIHFGQRGVNGAVLAFLCGGDGQPDCPMQAGTVTGTIRAEHILAIPSQGIAAGDFAGALTVIRAGLTYVNVHSTAFPPGEIRGQIV